MKKYFNTYYFEEDSDKLIEVFNDACQVLNDNNFEKGSFYISYNFKPDIKTITTDFRNIPFDNIMKYIVNLNPDKSKDDTLEVLILFLSDFTIKDGLFYLLDNDFEDILTYKIGPKLLEDIRLDENFLNLLLERDVSSNIIPIQPSEDNLNYIKPLNDRYGTYLKVILGSFIVQENDNFIFDLDEDVKQFLQDDVIQKGLILYNPEFISVSSISDFKLRELINDFPFCMEYILEKDDLTERESHILKIYNENK